MKLFIIFLLSPASIFLIYDVIFNYIPLYNNNYNQIGWDITAFMIYCNIVSICSFCLFVNQIVNKENVNIIEKKSALKNGNGIQGLYVQTYYFVFFVIFCLIHYLIYSVFNQISYFEVIDNFARFYALSKRGTAWVFVLIFALIFVLLIDFYKSGFNAHKASIFILSLLLVALTGGRSLVIILLMFFFFIVIVFYGKKIKLLPLFLVLFLMLLIFIGSAVMRADGIDGYLSSEAVKLDFDNIFVLNDVLKYLNNNNTPYFIFLEDVYYLFIPRMLMPDKPISTAETRLVYPDVAEFGTNFTFGIYANSFINIGNFTIFIVPFFLIYINYFYVKYIFTSHPKNIKNFVVVFLLFFSIQFARGGIFNSRLILVVLSIIVANMLYFIFPKQK